MPRADDFRLLDDLDEFNKHVKAAVAHLLDRGYHPIFVKWMLKQHQSYAGAQVLSDHSTLVDLVTMRVDEQTSGTRRRELIEALVEADALDGDGGNDKRHKRLRDRLSSARKWKRKRDRLSQRGVDRGFDDPGYIRGAMESVIDDLRGLHRTRSIAERLRVLGVLGEYEGLRDRSLQEVLKVVAEQLLFLKTVKLSRADRAQVKAAIRDLDDATREELSRAQDEYLDEIDAVDPLDSAAASDPAPS